ncbi:MAG TPA: hypothetical protein VK436_15455 [Methanocella sp.]|nr:hypothetical protein [Methanocella sp.]
MTVPITYIKKNILNIFTLFLSVFIFHVIFIFQGLDVTDMGYHLTNQILSLDPVNNLNSIMPLWYLTDLIGGIWLSLAGGPNLLWAKIGGVFLTCLNAIIIYSILSRYFNRQRVFFVVLISTITTTIFVSDYIHYFTLPALFLNIAVWIFDKAMNAQVGTKKFFLLTFLTGFWLVPIILSRFTLILILFIPLLVVLYSIYKDKNIKRSGPYLLPLSLGFICSAFLFCVIYWYIGILDVYTSYVIAMFSGTEHDSMARSHGFTTLLMYYLTDYAQEFYRMVFIFIVLFCFGFIQKKLDMKSGYFSVVSFAFLALTLMLFLYANISPIDILYYIYFLISLTFLLSILCFLFNRHINEKIAMLLFLGIAIMIIVPVGSNIGIIKSIYGMWLILPLSLLCVYDLKAHDITDSKKKLGISTAFSTVGPVLIVLLLLSSFFHIAYVYRDDNRFSLTAQFHDPSLGLIFSTPDRVNMTDELIYQVKKYSDKGDRVVFVNNIPLCYYLTETKPVYGETWPYDPIKYQETIEKDNLHPKLFIFTKMSTDNNHAAWPSNKSTISNTTSLNHLINRYEQMNYTLLWENNGFAIYGQKNNT